MARSSDWATLMMSEKMRLVLMVRIAHSAADVPAILVVVVVDNVLAVVWTASLQVLG